MAAHAMHVNHGLTAAHHLPTAIWCDARGQEHLWGDLLPPLPCSAALQLPDPLHEPVQDLDAFLAFLDHQHLAGGAAFHLADDFGLPVPSDSCHEGLGCSSAMLPDASAQSASLHGDHSRDGFAAGPHSLPRYSPTASDDSSFEPLPCDSSGQPYVSLSGAAAAFASPAPPAAAGRQGRKRGAQWHGDGADERPAPTPVTRSKRAAPLQRSPVPFMGAAPLEASPAHAVGRRSSSDGTSEEAPAGKKRSSRFRGVTKHRRSGRWEAHIWIKEIGRQVYLGGYEEEEHAAEAYDVAALKCKGHKVKINFEVERYGDLLGCMDSISLEELIMAVRRQSQGFSRGSSSYRGVTAHPSGRWESRVGIPGSKHVYLGLFDEERDAARSYDRALVRLRGTGAATNFGLSEYRRELAEYHQMEMAVLLGDKRTEAIMHCGPEFEKWIKAGTEAFTFMADALPGIADEAPHHHHHPFDVAAQAGSDSASADACALTPVDFFAGHVARAQDASWQGAGLGDDCGGFLHPGMNWEAGGGGEQFLGGGLYELQAMTASEDRQSGSRVL